MASSTKKESSNNNTAATYNLLKKAETNERYEECYEQKNHSQVLIIPSLANDFSSMIKKTIFQSKKPLLL